MPLLTANTISNAEDYLRDLGKVRRIGYAMDDGENEVDGEVCGRSASSLARAASTALSLSALASRLAAPTYPGGRQPLKEVAAESVARYVPYPHAVRPL